MEIASDDGIQILAVIRLCGVPEAGQSTSLEEPQGVNLEADRVFPNLGVSNHREEKAPADSKLLAYLILQIGIHRSGVTEIGLSALWGLPGALIKLVNSCIGVLEVAGACVREGCVPFTLLLIVRARSLSKGMEPARWAESVDVEEDELKGEADRVAVVVEQESLGTGDVEIAVVVLPIIVEPVTVGLGSSSVHDLTTSLALDVAEVVPRMLEISALDLVMPLLVQLRLLVRIVLAELALGAVYDCFEPLAGGDP